MFNEDKEKSTCKFCYIMGPTGPTGPTGPASITVGTTTTTDAGTNASVTNSGTNQNVILNFSIPRGSTGPMGPVGPTGPTGSSTGIDTYGERYTEGAETVSLTANQDAQVPLKTNGPSQNVSYNTANAITVNTTGTYQIYYLLNASSSQQGELTVSLRKNNIELVGTNIALDVTANQNQLFTGSIITTLESNDTIDLAVNQTVTATLSLDSSIGAKISIIKLN